MQPYILRLLTRLQPADHLCWLYADAGERQAALDLCAQAAAQAHAPFHALDPEPGTGPDALRSQVLCQLRQVPGAWLAADLTAAVSAPANGYGNWLEEAWAEARSLSTRFVGLYDQARLAPDLLLALLKRHNLIVRGGEAYLNDGAGLPPTCPGALETPSGQLACVLAWLQRSGELRQELERREEELGAFQSIARAVSLSLPLEEILQAALHQVASLVQADLGYISLWENHVQRPLSHALQGASPALAQALLRQGPMEELERAVQARGEPLIVSDARSSPLAGLLPPTLSEEGHLSFLVAPLRSHGQAHGTIALGARTPGHFGPEEAALLESLSEQIGVALDNARLYAETQKRVEEMRSLYDLSLAATSLDTQAVLQLMAEHIMRLFDAACFFVALADQENSRLHFAYIVDDGRVLEPFSIPLDAGGLTAHVLATGRPLLIADLEGGESPVSALHAGQPARSWLGVPLVVKDRTIGVMSVQAYVVAAYDEDDQRLLSLAAQQAASSLENARLYQEARALERRYHTLLEELNDGYAVLQDESLVFANARLARMLGRAPQEVQTGDLAPLFVRSGEPDTAVDPAAIEPGTGPLHYRTRLEPADGPELAVEVTLSGIEYEGRPALAVLCRDITGQVRLEAQLLQAEKLSAVGQLVSGVAHELNNPLTTIKGYAQLLQGESVSPGGIDDLKRIEEAADRCRRIVRDLLTFARRYEPEVTDTDVNELLQRTAALRSYELHLNDITVDWDLDPCLPLIQADPHRLQQVILNLIFNAEQALLEEGKGGEIRIRSCLAPGGKDVRVEIADDGPGIRPEHMDRIFDPFFTTKDVGRGTGLGLSISYGIVNEHGGRIWAQSRYGHGATFFVELPIAGRPPDASDADADQPVPSPPRGRGAPRQGAKPHGPTGGEG